MPRQMPSTGCASLAMTSDSLFIWILRIASAAAPTPGRMTWLEFRIVRSSVVNVLAIPRRSRALRSDATFAPPLSIIATSDPDISAQHALGCRHLNAFYADGLSQSTSNRFETGPRSCDACYCRSLTCAARRRANLTGNERNGARVRSAFARPGLAETCHRKRRTGARTDPARLALRLSSMGS